MVKIKLSEKTQALDSCPLSHSCRTGYSSSSLKRLILSCLEIRGSCLVREESVHFISRLKQITRGESHSQGGIGEFSWRRKAHAGSIVLWNGVVTRNLGDSHRAALRNNKHCMNYWGAHI